MLPAKKAPISTCQSKTAPSIFIRQQKRTMSEDCI